MGKQVYNSDLQVQADLRNLKKTGGCWEDTGKFIGLLHEVLPYGDALHYLLKVYRMTDGLTPQAA
jgi:hypothetical protein